jgi:hypothetical protein
MSPLEERGRNLAWDLLVFTEIVFYWAFAVLVMKPVQWFDRRFGTQVFRPLDRTTRWIAGR